MKIKIKKQYLTLVPRPEPDQFKSLLESIKEDGQHLPIVVNEKGYILDGYTRFKACNQLKITPEYEVKKFDDENEERRYVIIVNLSRRQLNLFQKGEVLFQWWKKERELGFARRQINAWKTRRGKIAKPKLRLNMRLGKMLGCQHTTAWKIMKILSEGDSTLIARCRTGTLEVTTAFRRMNNLSPVGGRTGLRHSKCLVCQTETIPAKTCHVHTTLCCSSPDCGWGI